MSRFACWSGYTLVITWFIVLVAPSATMGHTGLAPVLISAGFFALLWLAAGTRPFLVLTYPLAFLAVLAVGSDLLRGVDLIGIAMMAGTVDPQEAFHALAPYIAPMAATLLILGAGVAIGLRTAPMLAPLKKRLPALAMLIGAAFPFAFMEPAALVRAWPINVVSVEAALMTGRSDFLSVVLPWAPVSPRLPQATWSAKRAANAAKREIYVIVVGESVRADRLADCGGSQAFSLRHAATVYCDVTSGANSTHISVPLLLSREMPGAQARVSADATVLRAFEETGFRTYWIGEQEQSVAWPDANVIRYTHARTTSRNDLLPLVRAALAEPAAKKALVLHTYDAHFPYCERFDPSRARIPVDCAAIGSIPTAANRREWIAAYDNAVAESLAFLDEVIAELRASGDEAFLVYTSDHGENLLDDERGIYFHALSTASRFDTRVPMIFWSSPEWERNHAEQARALERHRNIPAMHADLVPTLLGAAAIRYADSRGDVVDLTRTKPAGRIRWVEPRLGAAVDGDRL